MAVGGGREMVGKIKTMAACCGYLLVCTSQSLAACASHLPPRHANGAENDPFCAANGEVALRAVS